MTTATDYSSYSVLVVDDHQLSLKLITKQLEVIGFKTVDLVLNGQEGLDKLSLSRYDIVIFDLLMPVMDGLLFLKTCRQNPACARTGFIMISSETQQDAVHKVLQAGATASIPKPVTIEMLKDKIDETLEWVRQQK